MPLGTAIGAISLTGNSSAFPPPVPLSNILGVNDPFYAVKNLNPVTLDANNPSCRYSFTYRFRIPATASSIAKIEDTVWCPSLVFQGLASGSADLSTFAYGSFYGRAFVTANLTGVSNGEVTVFAQAAGNAELTPSSSAEVTAFAIASGSMMLTSSAESGTSVPAVADSLGPLVGGALATTVVNAMADGDAVLEDESEASVDVFTIAEAAMALTGDSVSNISLIRASAGSFLELEGDSQASVSQEGVAEGNAELEGESIGEITLVMSEAGSEALLEGESEGNISLIPAESFSVSGLMGSAGGNISLISAIANSTAEITGNSDGAIVLPAVFDIYEWEEAFDASQILILGSGVGTGVTNNSDPNGAEIPNVGDPAFSDTSQTATFSGRSPSNSLTVNWNLSVNADTVGLNASGIGSSRVNKAVQLEPASSSSNIVNRFNFGDFSPTNGRIPVERAPIHYRALARINSGQNFTFISLTTTNSFSSPRFGGVIDYQSIGNMRIFAQTVYSHFGNALIASGSVTTPFVFSGTQWVLVDLIIRESPINPGRPQYELMFNGNQLFFDTTDTRFVWSSHATISGNGMFLRNNSSVDVGAGLFFGYRTGINFTLAEHNADRIALGL